MAGRAALIGLLDGDVQPGVADDIARGGEPAGVPALGPPGGGGERGATRARLRPSAADEPGRRGDTAPTGSAAATHTADATACDATGPARGDRGCDRAGSTTPATCWS